MGENNISNGIRIALVEDNDHDVLAFRRSLQKGDVTHEITRFERAEEARQAIMADSSSFSIVVTDFKLPGISGLDLCRELISREIHLPMVILTGAGSEDTAIEALKLGVSDYIIKDPYQRYLALLPVVLPTVIQKHDDRMERRRMEAALLESEKKYRNLFEHANDSILIIDPATRHFLDFNENAAKRLGYTKAELRQLTIDDIDTPTAAQRNDAIIRELMESGNITFEHAHLHKNGKELPIEISARVTEYGDKQVIQSIVRDISERKQAEEELKKRTHELGERVKELNCLYRISKLVEKYKDSLENIFQGTVDLIPPSWQYPEITCARIRMNGREFKTEKFKDSKWKQAANIAISGKPIGSLEVFYLEERPEIDEGPFLKEERSLIDAIASQLGRILLRLEAEAKLKRESDINAALSDLYEPLISPSASMADIANSVLEKSKSLTKSEHGFVSTINPVTGDNISHTLTEMLKNECAVTPDKGINFPMGPDGRYPSLWGHALNTGKPFFTNSAPDHQAASGIPDGHIPIQRFLSVPVMLGKELVGQIALANKDNDYTAQDLEAIGRVAEFYALAIQRNRARKELQVAHAELEQRVEARTSEIKQAYERLVVETKERRLAQEQLSRSKSMLQAVFDGISEPLILVDKNMKIKMINSAGAEYYGLADFQAAVDKICYEATGKSDFCKGCEIPQAVSNGQNITFERKGFMDADRLERIVIYPVKGNIEDTGDAILRITDITEERQFERQLIQSEKMASLGILVSSIAHEINNPNSFVAFNIPILKDYIEELMPIIDAYASKRHDFELCNMPYPEFREDIFKLLENIKHGSERISSFVTNLREYSLGKDENPRKWVEMRAVIEKVLSICLGKVKKSVKTFKHNIPEDLPQVYTDPYGLEQVLINLLLNAAQAANKKDSWVKLEVQVNKSWKDHIIIEVSDNGSGMDEKTQRSVFDPFFTTKPPVEGTGLGLYVSHNLIRDLGGRIELASESGQGSSFKVILPDKERRRKPRG